MQLSGEDWHYNITGQQNQLHQDRVKGLIPGGHKESNSIQGERLGSSVGKAPD